MFLFFSFPLQYKKSKSRLYEQLFSLIQNIKSVTYLFFPALGKNLTWFSISYDMYWFIFVSGICLASGWPAVDCKQRSGVLLLCSSNYANKSEYNHMHHTLLPAVFNIELALMTDYDVVSTMLHPLYLLLSLPSPSKNILESLEKFTLIWFSLKKNPYIKTFKEWLKRTSVMTWPILPGSYLYIVYNKTYLYSFFIKQYKVLNWTSLLQSNMFQC